MIVESVRNRNLGKSVEGRDDNDNIIVKYFRENLEDSERTVEVIDDFYPKIYVPADLDWETLKDEVLIDDIHQGYNAFWHGSPVKASVESISDETFEAYDGREVRELKLTNTKVVKPLRQMLEDFYSGKGDPHYEADVTFDNRYLIDTTDGQMEEKPLRTQYMDIEVSDEGGMPDIEEGRSEILSIACYDNVTEEYYIFTHKEEKVNEGEKVVEETDEYTVICFNSELEMIAAYLDDVEEKDPSVISGWNLVRFDFKYICSRISTLKEKIDAEIDRIEKSDGVTTNEEQSELNYLTEMKSAIDYNRLSPIENGVWAGGEYISVKGRELFDLYKAYRTLQWGEQESYKLGDVAQREIDRDKITMDMGFYEMYDKDFQKFLDYNKRDVELTVDLDNQMGIQEFWDEVRRICKTSLEEILISMRQVDNYILDYMNGQVILPSKSTDTEQGEDAEGGAVFDAPEGVLEDVAVLDLASLYPNLISQFNISPETIDKENGDINIPDSDVQITTEKEGILPQVFGELFDKREEYKEKMAEAEHGTREEALYDMRQGAVKIVMNCFEEDTAIRTGSGGRKRVQDLEVGDEVMTINPDTGEKEPKEVEKMNEQYNQFEAIIKLDLKVGYDKVKMGVTPHHRMVVKENQSSEIEIMEAQDLLDELEKGNIYYLPIERPSRIDSDVDFIWYPIREKHLYRKEDVKEDVYGPTVEDNRTIVAGNRSMMIGTGNTIYGVSLNPYFRLYNYDVGRSITKMGRETIKWSSEIADDEGFDSVYGDSVAPYTPTTVKIDGNPMCLSMEDLYEFWEDDRDREIEVWSDNDWTEVQDVIKKPLDGVNKSMKRVKTDTGLVTVTNDHSLLDSEGNIKHAKDVLWDDELLHHPVDAQMSSSDEKFSNESSDIGWLMGAMYYNVSVMIGNKRMSIRFPVVGRESAEKCKQILQHELGIDKVFTTDVEKNNKYSIKVIQEGSKPDGTFKELLKIAKNKFRDDHNNHKVPDFVWNANDEFKRNFIKGYMSTGRNEGTGERRALEKLQSLWIMGRQCGFPMDIMKNRYTGCSLLESNDFSDENKVRELVDFTVNIDKTTSIKMDAVYDISTESEHFQAGVGDMIVHNTDSIFVQKRDGEPSMKEINDLAEKIDESYREFVTEVGVPEDRDMFLEMEFEKYYKRIFFAAVKKRYAGKKQVADSENSVWMKREDGKECRVDPDTEIGDKLASEIEVGDKIDGREIVEVETLPVGDLENPEIGITGFEAVRSDNSQFARNLQEEVLEMIVEGKSRDDIIEHTREKKRAIKNGEVDISKVAIPKGIGKELDNYKNKPPQIRGAIYANRHFGTDFGVDDKPKMVYVNRTGTLPHTEVICFDEPSDIPDDIVINWNKMADKAVNGVVEQIFESMGWEISSLEGQQTLGDVL